MSVVAPTGLKFVKGEPVDFAEEFKKGTHVYIFEFWATWCPPCRKSIPHLTELQKKYKENNVVFVGITNEDESTVRPFVEGMESKMDYRTVLDTNGSASSTFMQAYGIQGIPHAFIIGKDGKISWHGHPMEPEMAPEIEKAVSAPAKSGIDLSKLTKEDVMKMKVKDIQQILNDKGIGTTGIVEKEELANLVIGKAAKF